MSYDPENPYQKLKVELDQTGVISDQFKGRLLSYVMAGLQYGHDKGRKEVVEVLSRAERYVVTTGTDSRREIRLVFQERDYEYIRRLLEAQELEAGVGS